MSAHAYRLRAVVAGVLGLAGGATGRGALATMVLRFATAGFGFLVTILLGRLLGPEGYGVYAYVFAWTALLTIPGVFGLNELLVREIAAYRERHAWRLSAGVLQWTNRMVLATSVVTAAAATYLLSGAAGLEARTQTALLLGLASVPFAALSSLRQATLRGLGRVVQGQVPELLIRPLLTFLLLVGAAWWLGDAFDGVWAVAMGVAATLVAYAVGAVMLRRALPREIREAAPAYDPKPWLHSALPFLFISGMFVVNSRADVILLGILADEAAVGIYSAAFRLAALVSFVHYGVNSALAPSLAGWYARDDGEEIEELMHRSTFWTTVLSAPIAAILLLFGRPLLSIFGEAFISGYAALAILIVGQLLNASTGSVGQLLNMTGHERDTALAVAVSAVGNVVLNVLMIPRWGLMGAAIATTVSTVVWNVLLAGMVYHRFRFISLFGLLRIGRPA